MLFDAILPFVIVTQTVNDLLRLVSGRCSCWRPKQQKPPEYPAQSSLRLVSRSPSDYARVWPVLNYHASAICLPHHVASSPETLHLAIAMLILSLLHPLSHNDPSLPSYPPRFLHHPSSPWVSGEYGSSEPKGGREDFE